VVGALVIAGLAAASLLAAACLRLESASGFLLAAYVFLVASVALLTDGLSPFRWVTQAGLGAGVAVLLAAAGAAWWRLGRPQPPLARARAGAALALRDPLVVGFVAVAGAALAYELLLVVTAPANNWDSLTYHLARVAFWAQHRGVYWIPNAPTDRINEFQPLAEQEILFLFVATGADALFALPQLVAMLATVAAIYLAARRLGYDLRGAACAGLLFTTFSLVALEATTSQNDLVAASLPMAAAAFLLGRRDVETALAGVAVALAAGVKLTTVLVVPALLLLAAARGRRTVGVFAAAGALGFLAFGIWSFVLNLAETGRVLGRGGGRVEVTGPPAFPGSVSTGVRVLYRLADLPGFSDRTIWALVALAAAGAVAALVAARRQGSRTALITAVAVAVPLLAPALALLLAGGIHRVVDAVRLPLNPVGQTALTFTWGINRLASEDFSGYGPLAVLVLAAPVATIVAAIRGRTDLRHLALGLALPVFLVLLALQARYYAFLTRFVMVGFVLTVPLLAWAFRRAAAGVAILAVAAVTVALALDRDLVKPFSSRPWRLSWPDAVRLNWMPAAGEALGELDQDAGSGAVGAVLGPDEPSYLLFGKNRRRHVVFLPRLPEHAVRAADAAQLPFVVVGAVEGIAPAFQAAGWRLQPLGTYWTLAIRR
jgi:hypothetical protein